MRGTGRNTVLIHAGRPGLERKPAPVNVAVVRTSTVRFERIEEMESAQIRRSEGDNVSAYGRHGTETHRALEEALCQLEGGVRAYLTPSGLGAISLALLALTESGDHI